MKMVGECLIVVIIQDFVILTHQGQEILEGYLDNNINFFFQIGDV